MLSSHNSNLNRLKFMKNRFYIFERLEFHSKPKRVKRYNLDKCTIYTMFIRNMKNKCLIYNTDKIFRI